MATGSSVGQDDEADHGTTAGDLRRGGIHRQKLEENPKYSRESLKNDSKISTFPALSSSVSSPKVRIDGSAHIGISHNFQTFDQTHTDSKLNNSDIMDMSSAHRSRSLILGHRTLEQDTSPTRECPDDHG